MKYFRLQHTSKEFEHLYLFFRVESMRTLKSLPFKSFYLFPISSIVFDNHSSLTIVFHILHQQILIVVDCLKGNNWWFRSKCKTCKNDFIDINVFDVIVARSIQFKVINHQLFISYFKWLNKRRNKVGQFVIVNALKNDAVIHIISSDLIIKFFLRSLEIVVFLMM